jgi:hypothetical protein
MFKIATVVVILLAVFVVAGAAADAGPYSKPGFVTKMEDGRLWVFRQGSKELATVESGGELAKHTTQIGAGPAGLTVKAPDNRTILEYLAAKPGFTTVVDGNRLWVFHEDSADLETFEAGGELAKHVTRVNAGPLDTTVKSPDTETLDAYLAYKEGFVSFVEDGRLWVFHDGSEDLKTFQKGGELAKHVTRVGAGPGGKTIKAPDSETIVDYMTKLDGFETFVNSEGRLWVFRQNSPALDQFYKTGHPEKHVTLIGAGPLGLTIKAPDRETADAYVRSYAASL